MQIRYRLEMLQINVGHCRVLRCTGSLLTSDCIRVSPGIKIRIEIGVEAATGLLHSPPPHQHIQCILL